MGLVVDGSVAVAYVHDDVVQIRSPRVRLYGATTPGSKLKVLVGVGDQQPADTVVYIGRNEAGDAVYVGMTNDFARRAAEHGTRFASIDQISTNLTAHQARSVEQVIIEANPSYQNVYNSVSYKRDIYDGALDWAKKHMSQHGISTHQ